MSGGALCSDYGLDTVRFRWRTVPEVHRAIGQTKTGQSYQVGQRGERYVQTPLGRVGAFPDGLVYLEGRVAALADGSPDSHRLGDPVELHSAERVARQVSAHVGADVGSAEARLGRVDLASELRFERGDEGRAFLHALASLDVPWCKARVDGKKGEGIETVAFHGTQGKTIYLRAYDKGVESGSDAPGRRVRVERQKRFRRTRETTVAEFQSADLHSIYVGREWSVLSHLPTATVCDIPGAMETLWGRAETWQQFERLAGFITAGHAIDYPRDRRYARLAELRKLGIFVDHTQKESLEVPVGWYLQTLASVWQEAV